MEIEEKKVYLENAVTLLTQWLQPLETKKKKVKEWQNQAADRAVCISTGEGLSQVLTSSAQLFPDPIQGWPSAGVRGLKPRPLPRRSLQIM